MGGYTPEEMQNGFKVNNQRTGRSTPYGKTGPGEQPAPPPVVVLPNGAPAVPPFIAGPAGLIPRQPSPLDGELSPSVASMMRDAPTLGVSDGPESSPQPSPALSPADANVSLENPGNASRPNAGNGVALPSLPASANLPQINPLALKTAAPSQGGYVPGTISSAAANAPPGTYNPAAPGYYYASPNDAILGIKSSNQVNPSGTYMIAADMAKQFGGSPEQYFGPAQMKWTMDRAMSGLNSSMPGVREASLATLQGQNSLMNQATDRAVAMGNLGVNKGKLKVAETQTAFNTGKANLIAQYNQMRLQAGYPPLTADQEAQIGAMADKFGANGPAGASSPSTPPSPGNGDGLTPRVVNTNLGVNALQSLRGMGGGAKGLADQFENQLAQASSGKGALPGGQEVLDRLYDTLGLEKFVHNKQMVKSILAHMRANLQPLRTANGQRATVGSVFYNGMKALLVDRELRRGAGRREDEVGDKNLANRRSAYRYILDAPGDQLRPAPQQ